jgi:hypothetical protein
MGIVSRASNRNKLDYTAGLIGYRYKQAFLRAITVLPTAANDFRFCRREVVVDGHECRINASATVSFLQMPQTNIAGTGGLS